MTDRYAFASDYDNTLFMHKLFSVGISRRNRNAISKFQECGGLFGLCTGRPYNGFSLDPGLKKIKIDFYIASTGAHILSGDGKVLFAKPIPFDVVREVYESEADNARHSIHIDGNYYMIRSANRKGSPILRSIDEAKGHDIYEFSFHYLSVAQAAETTSRINKRFGNAVTAFQNVRDIDVVAKGCSKGFGVNFIKEHFNLSYIGAMGDSLNDLSLIEAADFGYTFPSAPGELRHGAFGIKKNVASALTDFQSRV